MDRNKKQQKMESNLGHKGITLMNIISSELHFLLLSILQCFSWTVKIHCCSCLGIGFRYGSWILSAFTLIAVFTDIG